MRLTTRLAAVNGTRLYHEVRGSGPPVLFISGATGDAGHFDAVADRLASTFTVVTYDRRGNSRSPRPERWTKTTMDEQAADAAALVDALDLGPVTVFGTSGGAIVALCMLLSWPDHVRAALLHEPPLVAVLPDAAGQVEKMQRETRDAIETRGLPAALEGFLRFAGADVDRIPAATRERMFGNAETLFGAELEAFVTHKPDETALARVERPVRVLVGEEATPMHEAPARWLAERLGASVLRIRGGHTPYFGDPQTMAAELAPLLEEVLR